MTDSRPPVCDYEGSDYQQTFWDAGDREYEDLAEAKALRKMLPTSGSRLLEVGAGAGRNTPRYSGFQQVVLLDYSRTQLEQAQQTLGESDRYVYVVGDVYQLPFRRNVFDASTMIRTIHHLVDPQSAMEQVRETLVSGSTFILEYANKKNIKAIMRWLLRRQDWNPFSVEPVEFAELNFNFHPTAVEAWLEHSGFRVDARLTVSHFRVGLLKQTVPARWLAELDGLAQSTGGLFQLTPSVFVQATVPGPMMPVTSGGIWQCTACGSDRIEEGVNEVICGNCSLVWEKEGGIYDFKTPVDS